jgi:hypothetical protein
LILISFVCVVGFWTLGGVRMWTAAHVFFYGCSIYFSKQLKTGLILAASAVLVHFSFLFPVALLFVYLFFKPTHRILFYFFLATFFISSLNIQFVAKLIQNYTPEAFMTRAINYTNEDYAETISEINSTANWYTVNLNKVLLWAITGIYCVFQFKTKNIKRLSPLGNKFYGFSLLLLTAANLLTDLPSGIRYMVLAQLYALAAILIILFGNSISSLKNNIYFTIPFFIFFNIVSIRNAFETLTIDGVLSNPIFTLFAKTGIPIIDLIK